ncbi:MAG: hypothetical protein GAK35_00183 [Herbaspirillum frisingense]|uniref:Metal-dependent hydrolase n=1 Tax=Herbaspirillum frisingense TaxID=92645 RepID=A0A7V8G0F8_9BURK|nr:MAG: hypothetical protein GAK35_00183 [Herbaspirillum frisingense]
MSIAVPDLPVRKLTIDLAAGFARHWHGGDAYRSMYFNALSMSFPVGEQFFIDSVRAGLAALPDTPAHAPLRTLAAQFIGQEATHRHLHALYNRHLEQQGLRNHWQHWAQRRVDYCRRRRFSAVNQLAITAAYEHFTAVLAGAALGHQWLEGADEQMQTLWYWHSAEETEHKAVAFDLYRALGGGRLRRIAWYVYIFAVFATESTLQTLINLRRDRNLWRLRTWGSALRFWCGGNGMLRRCALPLLDYLRPGFHPDDDDNRASAARWLEDNRHRWTRVK